MRAKQDRAGDTAHEKVLSVLIHGDAAFAGQGVVAETLNLSELPGYDVGGTVHIVVNNQVGFTTPPGFARSTVYATDIAKAVQAPIFHVNGDDPEAAVRVIRLAFAFRQEFKKDVVVDMVCYRRYGHNEGDEPAFTQPRMYEVIGRRRSVRKLYTETLVNRGDLTLEECELALEDFRSRLEDAFVETQAQEPAPVAWFEHEDVAGAAVGRHRRAARAARHDRRRARDVPATASRRTRSSNASSKNRRNEFDDDRVDWALAESLAFGSLLHEGTPVRVAGQDTRRGTFSQRHAALVDHETEAEYTPLAHLGRRTGAVHDLRLGALGVRRARLRVRLLGRRSRRARRVGSAVRRLRERRADRSSTSSSSRPRTSGASAAASCCCSPTASKARAPSTPPRGSSASSCCAPRTTCASSTRPPPRSTSTCCAAR